MTPVSLNALADQWQTFLSSVKIETSHDVQLHLKGLISIYRLRIELVATQPSVFWYIGQTGRANPLSRLNEHRCEFRRCKTTTFNGKSWMYSPEYMDGLRLVHMHYEILESGLAQGDANHLEREISQHHREQYGRFVLTNP